MRLRNSERTSLSIIRRTAASQVAQGQTESFSGVQNGDLSVLGQVRRTQRYAATVSDDETVLVANVVSLATEYGRYGYRRITALLRADGWRVNHKRVERIWRQQGLKVPARQPKRG